MNEILKSKKLFGLAVFLGLVASIFPFGVVTAAGSLTGVGDSISPLTVSTAASHTITFTTATSIPTGGKIEITFASGSTFSLSGVTDADVAVTLTNGATKGTASVSGQKLTITTATAIATAGAQTVTLNGTNKITNPSAAGTYAIAIVTKNSSGVVLDSGYCLATIGGGTVVSITVKTYISMTISDAGSDGVQFGDVDPGTSSNPDISQSTSNSTTPSVTITVGSETNASVTIQGKLNADWSGSWAATTTRYSLDTYNYSPVSYTTSYATIKSGVAASGMAKLWHYQDVPAGQEGGTAQNTLLFQAIVP